MLTELVDNEANDRMFAVNRFVLNEFEKIELTVNVEKVLVMEVLTFRFAIVLANCRDVTKLGFPDQLLAPNTGVGDHIYIRIFYKLFTNFRRSQN